MSEQDWGGYKAATTPSPPVPRVACPLCGTPLDIKGGVLHCPFDGWTGNKDEPA